MSDVPRVVSAGPGAAAGDAPLHRFAHRAMGATFEVLVANEDYEYARQASEAAFEELDRLEGQLSRFIPSSDVCQVAALKAGGAVRVGMAALECLKTAGQVHAETGGAFDVTIGPLLALWNPKDGSAPDPSEADQAAARACVGMHHLVLCESEHAVGVRRDGVQVDFGGIGKGYAVDQMAALLGEWSIESALIHGGESSVLGIGAPPGKDGWPVSLCGPGRGARTLACVSLRDRALSGSGVGPRHRHIIDPRTGRPAAANVGAWAVMGSATVADALSTAFLVMSPAEVEHYCRRHGDVSGMLLTADGEGKIYRFGQWQPQRSG